MNVVLAITHHDPPGRLYPQIEAALPALTALFEALVVHASPTTHPATLALLARAGAVVQQRTSEPAGGLAGLGTTRRDTIALALEQGLPGIMFCDGDRALHWITAYPEELRAVVGRLLDHDFTVLGRTPRAFDTHPRMQRDTEAIVNHVFARVSGRAWDVTAAARGLSRRAARAILNGCPDETIGVDVAWPLFLQQRGGFRLAYEATEGLEFETPDRYGAEIAAAGGYQQWLAQLDGTPQHWAQRLHLAMLEVEAMLPYADPMDSGDV
jgi:hypothetical protein